MQNHFPDEGRVNKGSLAVAEGKIYLVENLPDIQADTVIDASGLFVSPGFIDHHCHVFYGGTGIGFLPDTGSFLWLYRIGGCRERRSVKF